MKKIFFKLCVCAGILGLVSCSSYVVDDEVYFAPEVEEDIALESNTMYMNDPLVDAKVFNKRVPELNSLLVCRDKQCAPAELSASKQYIFNALAHLVDNNSDATALLCEANPQAHVCVNPYLTIPAKIGVTPGYVFFDGVKVIDASQVKGKTALNLVLGYNLSYNGQTPYVCKPDRAMLYVKDNNNIVLNGNGFGCDMTSQGVTTFRIMFNIDYIDLDYGYLGGYYSIGMSGPAYGGGSGYAMIRLPNDAHPLNPVLKAPEEVKVKEEVKKPVVKPEVKTEMLADQAKEVEDVVDAVKKEAEENAVKVKDDVSKSLSNAKVNPNVEPLIYGSAKNSSNKNNEIIINPDEEDVPFIDDEPEDGYYGYEEVYVEDLDEYIK